jgi:tetratricopeptide (TPR) repeat protein
MRQRLLLSAVISLVFVPAVGQKSPSARDELNLGVQAYRDAKYDAAIEHLRNATLLDPQLAVAHLYLATAFAQQYVPGVETKENLQVGERAISEYKRVLDLDPNSPSASNAVKGIASLYFNMKRFDDSKQYHKLAIQRDPKDPEAHFSLAVIDWTHAYGLRTSRRTELHLQPEDPLIDRPACIEVRAANENNVEEGIAELANALRLRPDYDDAMAYMNLLYRERADIQCGDPDAYATDVKKADQWVDLAMATKKAKSEHARSSEQREAR